VATRSQLAATPRLPSQRAVGLPDHHLSRIQCGLRDKNALQAPLAIGTSRAVQINTLGRRYRSHFREAASFAVLLPNAGAEQGAIIAADLRGLISKCSVEAEDSEIRLSISVGVVQIDSDTKDEESVFIEADRSMYEDKRQAEAHN
jgi:hypothetical protein